MEQTDHARIQHASGGTLASSSATKSEILKSRARSLARQQSTTVIEDSIEVAEFLLGAESYAFELAYLREVCPLSDVTFIPCAPSFVVGVINLRGLIITIIDIMAFLDISHERVHVFNKAVILQEDEQIVGLLADEVVGASKVPITSMQSMAGLSGLSAEYIRGITKERMVVLDAKKILGDPRFAAADGDE